MRGGRQERGNYGWDVINEKRIKKNLNSIGSLNMSVFSPARNDHDCVPKFVL